MLKVLITDDNESWRNFNKDIVFSLFGQDNVDMYLANSAMAGYDTILQNDKNPFDLIISDLQMESNFAPMSAGEWFVIQIKNTRSHLNTKIIIVSGMYNIEYVANNLNVDFLPKRMLVAGGELPMKLKLEEMGFKIDN